MGSLYPFTGSSKWIIPSKGYTSIQIHRFRTKTHSWSRDRLG